MLEIAEQIGAGDVNMPGQGDLEIGDTVAVPIRLQDGEFLPARLDLAIMQLTGHSREGVILDEPEILVSSLCCVRIDPGQVDDVVSGKIGDVIPLGSRHAAVAGATKNERVFASTT
jgi:hypothetical protein